MEWIKLFGSPEEARQRVALRTPQLVLLGQRRICLLRLDTGWFAIDDRCSHNGESLSKGRLNHLNEVVCPWHGYQFQVTTGRECAQRSDDLMSYPVREEEHGVFIGC